MASIGNFQRRGLFPAVLGPRQEFYSVLPSTPQPNPFCFRHLGPQSPLQCRLLQDWLLHNLIASHHVTGSHQLASQPHTTSLALYHSQPPFLAYLLLSFCMFGTEKKMKKPVLWAQFYKKSSLFLFFFFFDAGGTQLPRKEISPSAQIFRCFKSHLWGKGYQIKSK